MTRPFLARSSARFLIAAVLLALLLLVTHALWLSALGRYLVDSDAPAPADAVVVLAGDLTGKRLVSGANLVARGLAPKVLVSGPNGLFGAYESDFAIDYAVRRGYPESYFIAVHNKSKSTEQEAAAILPELRRLGAHRVDIVTTNFHTRRARKVYHAMAPDLELHVIAAEDDTFKPDSWWLDRENRKTFLMEWMKTVGHVFGM